MNPLKLTFTANEQTLTKTDNFTDFASNTVSYIESTFTLGENWTGYDSVRAVWKTDYYTISTVLDANFTCVVPTEVLRYKAKVFVNLVGSIVENDTLTDRLTTFPVLALTVKANAAVNGSETAPVTPSQFEQFVDTVREEAESISDYSYDSEAWAVGTRGGVDVPSTDPTYHKNSKYWAEQNAGLADDVADLEDDVADLKSDLEQAIEDFAVPTQEAVDNWLDAHPEATTTVEDGAITTQKLSANLKNTIVPLSKFNGSTDGERLYIALITDGFKGTISGGNITIDESVVIPNATIREVKIANAIITLNADMFVAESDNFARLPSFINCKFIGNGHAIMGSNYGVFGNFVNCSFYNCSLINNASGTVQSAYFAYCEVLNNTVPFIKANNIYDCRIDGMVCERQNATLIDTFDSTGNQGGVRSLWVSNSMFEGFQATVFKLAGGGPSVSIKDCYFEANADACLKLKKSDDGYDYVFLEIAGNKVNSSVTPFEISGFTNNSRVNISVHDNYYYTSVAGTPMCAGIPVDNPHVRYNNRVSSPTDIINETAQYIYEPNTQTFPTEDTTKIVISAGGWVQNGRICYVDFKFKAKVTQSGSISGVITGFPKPSVGAVRLPIHDSVDAEIESKEIYITTAGTATIYGGITTDEVYMVRGLYFTGNKVVK